MQYIQDSQGRMILVPTGHISSATNPMVLPASASYGFNPSYTPQMRVGIPGLSGSHSAPPPPPPASSQASALNGQNFGYLQSHVNYNEHRASMAGLAYASDVGRKGLIEITLVELGQGKRQWKPIGVRTSAMLWN